MTREQRTQQLREKLAAAEATYRAAQAELARHEKTPLVGDRVRYTETCNRGCCEEWTYEGLVRRVEGNDCVVIVDKFIPHQSRYSRRDRPGDVTLHTQSVTIVKRAPENE
jgi:hypothetical protein